MKLIEDVHLKDIKRKKWGMLILSKVRKYSLFVVFFYISDLLSMKQDKCVVPLFKAAVGNLYENILTV